MKKIILVFTIIIGLYFQQNAVGQQTPIVQKAKFFRKTLPLRDMKKIMPGQRDRSWKDGIIKNEVNIRKAPGENDATWHDPVAQEQMGRAFTNYPIVNHDGIGNVNGVLPPDTEGDVGLNHYFQMINLSFAIYDKSGNLLDGPYDNSTLWDGFIGPWTGTNDGDPVVLYDQQADRWMVSQFAVNTSDNTYWELIAVSETGDPTGSYYQYAFQFSDMNDYPKIGIWPDGYYASFNMFGSTNRGAVAVFERDSILNGSPGARMVLFDPAGGSEPWSMLPSDFNGTPPPANTPNYFMYFLDYTGSGNDRVRIWEFDVDWNTPANSTFTDAGTLYTSDFDSEICSAYRGRCIPQPGTNVDLETLSDRLMYRLQYRNFGTYETMVVNHTVDVSSGHAGIRWYEFRDTGSGWTIYQEGTYAPDADHRWMGSIAMDVEGNIALGYSVSGSTTYPSIRYTGRLASDPLGVMTFAETEIIAGGGSQTHSAARWGDYSTMSIDPSDDSTFWYTTEYLQSTSSAEWKTRIASFRIEPSAPVADFTASANTIFVNTAIVFTDMSTGIPTTWSWNITPATITYINSTTATSQNPEVEFNAIGTYTVELTASNALGSDSETKTNFITVIDNSPVTLPWVEDFENAAPPLSITTNTDVINGIPRWSYAKTDNGRLRFQAGSGFYHGGSQAATLDADPSGTVSINYLIATINLSNYTSQNLLLSLYYMQHGEENSANDRVWIRGSQSDAWIEIYDLYANMAVVGTWKDVNELDITATLSAAVPPQTVSSTFQIRLGQEDNYPASSTTELDGFTFDDIRVEVSNDAPVVDFTANITSAIPYTTIQFTDLSTKSPTQWQWNFPGATPTSSSQQNPSIEYQETGYFDVTLTGTNASGSSFLSKADYILIHSDNTIFYDDFETMAGWTLTDEFEIGTPGALGGNYGNPDPPGAYEGSKALGVDITGAGTYSGDYEANLTDRQCQAVSPTFDCSGYATVILSFMRWLNVEQPLYDHAYIDIFDGTSWHTLWSNTATIEDNSWSLQEYDISSFAANQPVVQVRFSVGVTDGLWQYSGWNIDNLRITGYADPTLHNISWTGAQDSVWNNAPNWSNGQVPGVNTNVTIPAFVPGGIMPKVFSQPSNVIHNLNIEPGAEIIITTGDTLIIRE